MPIDKFGGGGGPAVAGWGQFISTAGLVHKSGDTMLGILSAGGFRITNVGASSESTDVATRGYADAIDQDNLQLSGGTMAGDINMGGRRVTGLPTADLLGSNSDAASWGQVLNLVADATTKNKQYVETQANQHVLKTGDTLTGDLCLSVGDELRVN